MKLANRTVAVTIIIALLAAVIAALLPLPPHWVGTWADFHLPIIVYFSISACSFGSALLLVYGARVYKQELRRIYGGIALGLTLTALSNLQLPIINSLSAWNSPWVRYGFIGFPYITAAIILYLSMRRLARLVAVKSLFTRLVYSLLILLGLGVTTALLPHRTLPVKEVVLDASNVVAIVGCSLYGLGGVIALQIRGQIGRHYSRAMLWLALSELFSSAVGFAIMVYGLLTGAVNGTAPAILAFEAISPVIQLTAGYVFAQTSTAEQRIDSGDTDNIVDMITYAAGLVSNLQTIDPMLDQVRIVTAKAKPDTPITADDERLLFDVYLQIEDYLATKEPIRAFTPELLRREMRSDLRERLAAYSHTRKG